jgi:hypothetical protein
MKYQVGDLLHDPKSSYGLGYVSSYGLGYVSGIIKDTIQITWFGRTIDSYLSYHYEDVDQWIKNGYTIHYPIGKQ